MSAQVTNSARGYFGYPNYRPFEINVLQRIRHQGWWKGRVGKFRWGALVLPIAIFQTMNSFYYYAVFRRNYSFQLDEEREVNNRLYPIYKHAEEKFRYSEVDELRTMSARAAFELGDDFDFDELRIYHYSQRHPDAQMPPQMNIMVTA